MKEGIRVGLGARELSCQVIKCVLIQSLCLHNFNFILLKIVPDTESVMTHEVWKNVPGLDIMRRAWYVTYAKSTVPPRCKKLLDYESWAQTTRCIWVGWQSAEEEQKHLREEHTFANTFNFIKVEKNKYKAAALEVIFYVCRRKAAVDSQRLENNESMSQVKVASPEQLWTLYFLTATDWTVLIVKVNPAAIQLNHCTWDIFTYLLSNRTTK